METIAKRGYSDTSTAERGIVQDIKKKLVIKQGLLILSALGVCRRGLLGRHGEDLAATFLQQADMPLDTSGRTTGIVMGVGHGVSRTVHAREGNAFLHA